MKAQQGAARGIQRRTEVIVELGKDPIHQRIGEAFQIAAEIDQAPAVADLQTKGQRVFTGYARGLGFTQKQKSGDGARVEFIGLGLANTHAERKRQSESD
jgi:hypothetical protein